MKKLLTEAEEQMLQELTNSLSSRGIWFDLTFSKFFRDKF